MWLTSNMQSTLTAKDIQHTMVAKLGLHKSYMAVRLTLHLNKEIYLYLKHGNFIAGSL